jgi:hypothetical protein
VADRRLCSLTLVDAMNVVENTAGAASATGMDKLVKVRSQVTSASSSSTKNDQNPAGSANCRGPAARSRRRVVRGLVSAVFYVFMFLCFY